MSFGERLKNLRQEKEVTQAVVGKVINIGARMIGYYESDKHFPKDATSLIKLAEYFDVSFDYLFGVSNIRNYDDVLKSFNIYKSLPLEGRDQADEYMKFLVQKYKVTQLK